MVESSKTPDGEPKPGPSTSRVPLGENQSTEPIPSHLARAHADKVIQALERNRNPGDQYDAYQRPTVVDDRRQNRRNYVHLQNDRQEEEQPEDEGVRIATLAFFTMMALMGFLCTYLLVYVVEPMTARHADDMYSRQAKHGDL